MNIMDTGDLRHFENAEFRKQYFKGSNYCKHLYPWQLGYLVLEVPRKIKDRKKYED